MLIGVLFVIALLVPSAAMVIEHVGDVRISERHHSHHDTYVVPVSFTRSLALAMGFMGVLGILLGWLCYEGFLGVSALVVLAFFDAFLVTCLGLWLCIGRYRVSVFSDSMVVTPVVGRNVWVRYDEIERLEWTGLRMESGFRSLAVWVGGRRAATLLGIVDVEQIIMSMDRFDLLPQTN